MSPRPSEAQGCSPDPMVGAQVSTCSHTAEPLTILKRAAVDDVRIRPFTQGVVGTDLHLVVAEGVEVTQLC